MADWIVEAVTKNIVSVLDGQSITYGGYTKTLTADRTRAEEIYGNRYPIIIVGNPLVQPLAERHRTQEADAFYELRFYDDTINDEYSSSETITPMSEVFGNVPAEINRLIMADHTRGEYAFTTDFNGCMDFFDSLDDQRIIYCFVISYKVRIIYRWNDFYTKGG